MAIGHLPSKEKKGSTFWDLFSFRSNPAKGPAVSTPEGRPMSSRAGQRVVGLKEGVLPENVMILTIEKQLDDPEVSETRSRNPQSKSETRNPRSET